MAAVADAASFVTGAILEIGGRTVRKGVGYWLSGLFLFVRIIHARDAVFHSCILLAGLDEDPAGSPGKRGAVGPRDQISVISCLIFWISDLSQICLDLLRQAGVVQDVAKLRGREAASEFDGAGHAA